MQKASSFFFINCSLILALMFSVYSLLLGHICWSLSSPEHRVSICLSTMHALISMASAQLSVVKATSLNFINLHMFEAQPGSLFDPAFWVFIPTQLILQLHYSSIQSFLLDSHFRIKQKEGEHMDGKTESCQRTGCRERPGDIACSWGRKNIKRERSASKRHFHNCPVSRPWWAKGSEKKAQSFSWMNGKSSPPFPP